MGMPYFLFPGAPTALTVGSNLFLFRLRIGRPVDCLYFDIVPHHADRFDLNGFTAVCQFVQNAGVGIEDGEELGRHLAPDDIILIVLYDLSRDGHRDRWGLAGRLRR